MFTIHQMDDKTPHMVLAMEFNPIRAGRTADDRLRSLALSGLADRLGVGTGFLPADVVLRLDQELAVVREKGCAAAFLMVAGMVSAMRHKGVPVGAGRAKAPSFLVNFAISIVDVNPLDYGLHSMEFLNPWARSVPTFVVELGKGGAQEAASFLQGKYGIAPSETIGSKTVYQCPGAMLETIENPALTEGSIRDMAELPAGFFLHCASMLTDGKGHPLDKVLNGFTPTSFMDLAIAYSIAQLPGRDERLCLLADLKESYGNRPVRYEWEGLLSESYGYLVFKEQAEILGSTVGGLDPERSWRLADAAMKCKRERLADVREDFMSLGVATGHDAGSLERCWDIITGDGKMAYSKSHAVGVVMTCCRIAAK